MVDTQIAARGIRDLRVLDAMRIVPREIFLSEELSEFAYYDTALPIEEEQTISQPYIVARMVEALNLQPDDKILEIGCGSGYHAAVMSRLAGEVFTIERHEALVELARGRLKRLGYDNVRVVHGNGTMGYAEHAPYDAIVVAAGAPGVPQSLLDQLRVGGRLIIPIGPEPVGQVLTRFTRTDEKNYQREELGDVRFVPFVGSGGWAGDARSGAPKAKVRSEKELADLMARSAIRFNELADAPIEELIDRIGDARVVLLGESTHGTSEFYRMRARITEELVLRSGFNIVAVEADWPDASRIDRYVRHASRASAEWRAFSRFPTWMWRNQETLELVEWLREANRDRPEQDRVSFNGLDLYSLSTSAEAVLKYLDRVDPNAAKAARQRYGCLSPWESDPGAYGLAALTGQYRRCEKEVVATLREMLAKRLEYAQADGDDYFDAVQNASLVVDAEEYYRAMYYSTNESWNLRDKHMFSTLERLLEHRGPSSKAIVWAHNSHIGDATATEMGAMGELNIGELARKKFGDQLYAIGFGTDHGTVAAASAWDAPRETKDVRPALLDSYEGIAHRTGIGAFMLPLRGGRDESLVPALTPMRLERAIGVIYRPETERRSHYFNASLPRQFDEWIFFDETRAVSPLGVVQKTGIPDTYPFGL